MNFMDLHDMRSCWSLLATYCDASGLKTQQDLELGQPGEVEPLIWCLWVDLRQVVLVHTPDSTNTGWMVAFLAECIFCGFSSDRNKIVKLKCAHHTSYTYKDLATACDHRRWRSFQDALSIQRQIIARCWNLLGRIEQQT